MADDNASVDESMSHSPTFDGSSEMGERPTVGEALLLQNFYDSQGSDDVVDALNSAETSEIARIV